MNHPNDPIIEALGSQARAYEPELPADLNRGIRSALAAVASPEEAPRYYGAKWPIAATVVTGALLAAAMVFQHAHPGAREIVKIPPGQQPRNVATATPHTMIASSANPLV